METWNEPVLPDRPLVPYHSSDSDTIARHVKWAREAGIDVLVSAWYGPHPSNPTETNFKTLLDAAHARGLRAALLFETDSQEFFPSPQAQHDAIRHALAVHARHPAYLRHQGKPVLFFWRPRAIWAGPKRVAENGPGAIEAWRQLRDAVDPHRTSIWIAEGDYVPYLQVFDGLMPYSIAWSQAPAQQLIRYGDAVRAFTKSSGTEKLWVATAMPGYDDTRVPGRAGRFAVDRQDGEYFRRTFAGAVASRPTWITITSFNEWVEGSQIEPSVSYGNVYLDLTGQLSAAWKTGRRP